jgi:hypothetical protein
MIPTHALRQSQSHKVGDHKWKYLLDLSRVDLTYLAQGNFWSILISFIINL